MAKKTTKSKLTKRTTKTQVKVEETPSVKISHQIKLSESYISLALGAIVVLLLAIGFFALVKGGSVVNRMDNATKSATPGDSLTPTPAEEEQSYILPAGEGLWDVAVKFYGDGYKWPVIAEANNLGNADYVEPGTKLKIPKAR